MPTLKSTRSIDTSHDAIALALYDNAQRVYLKACELADISSEIDLVSIELEYLLPSQEHVDVAFLDVAGDPLVLFEVKSQFEQPSASAWTRQTRKYARSANAPCLLVVGHDLGEVQKDYLHRAGTLWFDVRML